MKHPDAADLWCKDFIATLRLIGSAAARLPFGVPEPVLGGDAAIELYSGGLWPTRKLELLVADTRRLQAELMGTGFHRDECSPSFSVSSLWHPTLGRGVSMTVRPVHNANVVAVEIGTASPHDATTIRVVSIEDLIADQITGAIGQGGRRSEMATLVQVLVELGRAGVAGPFRPAYLQRRLARETGGEAVLETPPAPYGLDDPSPRVMGLVTIASLVRRWRASRDLPRDAADFFDGEHRTARAHLDIRKRNEARGEGERAIKTAQIIPFRSYGQ